MYVFRNPMFGCVGVEILGWEFPYAIPWSEIMLPEQSTVPYQKIVEIVPS
jgi:hypothetical protein